MSRQLNREERVRAALAGVEIDRPPFSVWGHDFVREWTAQGLADATIERFELGSFDFVKINPRFTYFVEDWGARFERPSGDRPKPLEWPVKSAGDFRRLPYLDPESGALREQMDALDLVREKLPDDVPFLQTIFSPLSIARNLVGEDHERLMRFIEEDPDAVAEGLDRITEVYADYVGRIVDHGAAGIFYATTKMGSYDVLSKQQFETFSRPYDLRILKAASDAWFNVFHVCSDNNMLDLVTDMPVAAFSWAATSPTNASLAEGAAMTGKAVMGGISGKTVLVDGPAEAIVREVRAAGESMNGRRLLIAADCSIPVETPDDNIITAFEATAGRFQPV